MRWIASVAAHRGYLVSLGLILVLGAGLRLAVQSHAPGFVVNRDSGDFFLAGFQLATSGEFPLPVKRAPMYPLFLAGVIAALGPSLLAATMIQHLLGLVTIMLAYALGSLAFGRVAGLIAALGAALNGSLLLMEQTIVSETVVVPLVLGSLVAVLLALRHGRLTPGRLSGLLLCLAGALLGLAALTRPVAQAILPLLALAVVVGLQAWRPRLLALGLLGLGFCLVVGPWIARNQAVHGVASISSGLGDALVARTHRHDTGFEWRDRGELPVEPERALIRARVFALAANYEHEVEIRGALQAELGLSDVQADAALREAAILVIRQQPLHWLSGTLRFFGEVWHDFDKPLDVRWETSTKPKYTRSWPEPIRPFLDGGPQRTDADQATVERLTELYQDYNLSLPMTAFFVLGLLRCLAAGWRTGAAIVPLVVLSQLLLYVALDGPLVRYRYAVQPLITLVAAGGLTWLLGMCWARLRTRPGRSLDVQQPTVSAVPVQHPSPSGRGLA